MDVEMAGSVESDWVGRMASALAALANIERREREAFEKQQWTQKRSERKIPQTFPRSEPSSSLRHFYRQVRFLEEALYDNDCAPLHSALRDAETSLGEHPRLAGASHANGGWEFRVRFLYHEQSVSGLDIVAGLMCRAEQIRQDGFRVASAELNALLGVGDSSDSGYGDLQVGYNVSVFYGLRFDEPADLSDDATIVPIGSTEPFLNREVVVRAVPAIAEGNRWRSVGAIVRPFSWKPLLPSAGDETKPALDWGRKFFTDADAFLELLSVCHGVPVVRLMNVPLCIDRTAALLLGQAHYHTSMSWKPWIGSVGALSKSHELDADALDRAKRHFGHAGHNSYRRVAPAISRLAEALARTGPYARDDRIFDLTSAMERMYGLDQGEVTFKLRTRAGCFLEPAGNARLRVARDVERLYRVRSKIVRRVKARPSAQARVDAFTKGFDVARRTVMKLLSEEQLPDWNETVITGAAGPDSRTGSDANGMPPRRAGADVGENVSQPGSAGLPSEQIDAAGDAGIHSRDANRGDYRGLKKAIDQILEKARFKVTLSRVAKRERSDEEPSMIHSEFRPETVEVLAAEDLRSYYLKSKLGRAAHTRVQVVREVPTVGRMRTLVEQLRSMLAPFLDTERDVIGHGLFGIPAAGTRHHPGFPNGLSGFETVSRVGDFADALIFASACLGTGETVRMLHAWSNGEPVLYRTRMLLVGVAVGRPLALDNGVAIEPLPNSADELPSSLPLGGSVREDEFLGGAVLSVPTEAAPVFFRPASGASPYQPATRDGNVPTVRPSWALDDRKGSLHAFFGALSLAGNRYAWGNWMWKDNGNLTALSFDQPRQLVHVGPDHRTCKRRPLYRRHLEFAWTIYARRVTRLQTSDKLDVAVERWVSSKRADQTLADRFIELRIALEALFLNGEKIELRYRLALNGAVYIGSNAMRRQSYFKILRGAYDKASTAVHEGYIEDTEDHRGLLEQASNACRKGILRRLLTSDAPDWEEMIFGCNDADGDSMSRA